MKIRYYLILIGLLFAGMTIYGLVQRNSYTDYNSEASPLEDSFVIGIFPDDLMDMEAGILNDKLDEQNYILEVTCTGENYFRFSCTTQKVTVDKVFKGKDINVGDEISALVAKELFIGKSNQINGKDEIDVNFTNVMTVGEKYLLFLDRTIDNHDPEDVIYDYSQDFLIRPCFAYKDITNGPLKTESDYGYYSSYSVCKNYEFFMESKESLDKMENLKNQFINKYPE